MNNTQNSSPQPLVAIHAINAYTNVFIEATANELNLADSEIQALIGGMFNNVNETLEKRNINYSDLRWALTPRSDRSEVAFIFDSSKAVSPFYGEEFSEIWLAAMDIAGGPRKTAILEGDILEPLTNRARQAIDQQLSYSDSRNNSRNATRQYFVVYFTNVSGSQLEVLDQQMHSKSNAYLGYIDCSCWSPFKGALLLPQVGLRIENRMITVEDDEGNANLRGYPFKDFGYEVVGVDEILYGTMLEFRIDIGASQWSAQDTSVSIGALSGVLRDISSMNLILDEARFKYLTDEVAGHGTSILKAGLAGLSRHRLTDAIKKELSKGLLYNLRSVEGSKIVKGVKVSEPKNDALMFSVQVEFPDITNTPQRYQVGVKYDTAKHRGEIVTMYG